MLDLLRFVTASPAFQFLRATTPFDFLPDTELERLDDALSIAYFPKGSTLFAQGQSAVKDLYVVMSGALELVDEAAGPSDSPRVRGVGEVYGSACLLTNDGTATVTVRASEDTFLYVLPGRVFLEACARHREFRDFFDERLGPRLLRRAGESLRQKWLWTSPEPDSVGFSRPIRDLCDRGVPWCSSQEPIREVAHRMSVRRCRSLLVRGEKSALVGVVTERDLVERALAVGLDPSRPVSEVMTPAGAPAPADMRLAEAMEVMVEDKNSITGRLAGAWRSRYTFTFS